MPSNGMHLPNRHKHRHARRTRRHRARRELRVPQTEELYAKIIPIFEDFGFTPPSAGHRSASLEKIEKAIIEHCQSFRKGDGPAISAGSTRIGKSKSARIPG
jgi:hypothetical protein